MASASPFIETDNTKHLNVPVPRAPQYAESYFIYSLYSVVEYFANYYPDAGIRRGTNRVSIDDLKMQFSDDEGGWRPKQDVLTQLSNQIRSIRLSTEQNWGEPPQELTEIVNEHINRYCPLIVFIDGLRLREGGDIRGPIYSAVVAGQDRGQSVLVDPLEGRKQIVKNQKLDTAWDEELHQVVEIKTVAGSTAGANIT